MVAKRVDSTTFQRAAGQVLYDVAERGETIMVTAHGRPRAFVVPVLEYRRLLEGHMLHAQEARDGPDAGLTEGDSGPDRGGAGGR